MPRRLAKQRCPWEALWQRNSWIFWAKSRRFEARVSKTSELSGSKALVLMASPVDRRTEDKWPRHPPLHAGKSQPVGGRSRPPTPTNKLSVVPGAEKIEYFITFPASALVWKALLGLPSVHFGSDSSPQGAFPWTPARGYPPFGPVSGLNCTQSSHELEPPLGRACLRV